uniref:DDE Tnp4 domain-containing protein n=1 Tax=Acrobeloides nanus TaxID=290746 RepID=A0A914DF67_9BILA
MAWIEFEANRRPFNGAIILGDSIYPRRPWLCPMRPHAPANERAFFASHSKTRRLIENTFGIWKNRWRVLKELIRVKSPEYSALIIKSTAILHNFQIFNRLEEENDDHLFEDEE